MTNYKFKLLIIVGFLFLTTGFGGCSKGFESMGSSDNSSLLRIANDANLPIRRLSNLEFRNSLTDAVMNQYEKRPGSPNIYSIFVNNQSLQGALSELPADWPSTKLGTDQISSGLSTSRMTAYIDIATALSATISKDDVYLTQFAGGCAINNESFSDQTCIDNFVMDFGTQLFRTPPTLAEKNDLKKGISKWQELLGRMFLHPRFLLHIDRAGERVGSTYRLTPYEIESRLTSLFWKSVPDAEGLRIASGDALKTTDGLNLEIDRILNSPKAKDTMWEFFKQWLAVYRLPYNYAGGAGYDEFAKPLTSAQMRGGFKDAVFEDARDFLEYHTFTNNGSLEDIFTSPLIFTTDTTVASIYGVAPRANKLAPPVVDPTGHYIGILTRQILTQQRPAVEGDTNHILRGVFVLTNILGYKLGQPANFAEQEIAGTVIPTGSSTRVETEIKTSPASCRGCHSKINPAGYALSNFDSLGRYWTIEKRYRDEGGRYRIIANNPVDSTSELNLGGRTYNVSDVPTLVAALKDSGRLYEGFARYYFRFAFGRMESTVADENTIALLIASLKLKSVKGALKAIALEQK